MRITFFIICVLVIQAQTAALEPDNMIEILLRKVEELERNQNECSSYQSRMMLELSYVKDKLEQSERRISELEAIGNDMRSDEYTKILSPTLEKDPIDEPTNKTVTQFITEETNVNRIPGHKEMTSHKPAI
ncbi:hypothetical protein CHS0354_017975 [Potamilus streckersoni]|uniref:Uncharacterized protein n=1 Tax=Potamilus streckersoni TaxID=2493646 RepID=A0AAE0VJZ7_9BIVA|nr:hypothetical protein CHS0354_017975 [Potamilus streckersoni]